MATIISPFPPPGAIMAAGTLPTTPPPAEGVAREFERLKADFLGTASHELRTPLSAILGYAELLLDDMVGPLSAEQAEFVGHIEANAQRLIALVEAMLDAARHEKLSIELQPEELDLATLLIELATALAPTARQARVALEVVGTPGPVTVCVDPRRFRQAVAALVENAIKFTLEGGRIGLRALYTAKGGRLEVADDGIGIPPACHAQVFQKFYQVDGGPTRRRNGCGLGLYVAKAVIEAHGGQIGVESEFGAGSTFWIEVPAG